MAWLDATTSSHTHQIVVGCASLTLVECGGRARARPCASCGRSGALCSRAPRITFSSPHKPRHVQSLSAPRLWGRRLHEGDKRADEALCVLMSRGQDGWMDVTSVATDYYVGQDGGKGLLEGIMARLEAALH